MNTLSATLILIGLAIIVMGIGAIIGAALFLDDGLIRAWKYRAWMIGGSIVGVLGLFVFAVGMLEAYGMLPNLLGAPSYRGPSYDTRTYEKPEIEKAKPRNLMDEAKKQHENAVKDFEEKPIPSGG